MGTEPADGARRTGAAPGLPESDELPQFLPIQPSYERLLQLTGWSCLVVAVGLLALAFRPAIDVLAGHSRPAGGPMIDAVFLTGGLIFGLGAGYCLRQARRLPLSAIMVDDDGLWLAHRPREHALVRWSEVARARERPLLQRLDLLGHDGRVLLRLEYQLVDFTWLRVQVAERSAASRPPPSLPARFRKSTVEQLTLVLSTLLFGGLAAYGWRFGPSWEVVLLCAFVAAGLLAYLTTAWQLVVDHDALRLHYPLRAREFGYDDITEVRYADRAAGLNTVPTVAIVLRDRKKPMELTGYGADAVDLARLLAEAVAARKAQSAGDGG